MADLAVFTEVRGLIIAKTDSVPYLQNARVLQTAKAGNAIKAKAVLYLAQTPSDLTESSPVTS